MLWGCKKPALFLAPRPRNEGGELWRLRGDSRASASRSRGLMSVLMPVNVVCDNTLFLCQVDPQWQNYCCLFFTLGAICVASLQEASGRCVVSCGAVPKDWNRTYCRRTQREAALGSCADILSGAGDNSRRFHML